MICTRWLEPIVKTFLDASGFSEEDFNQRLALRCLMTLEREIPVSGSGSVSGTGEDAQHNREQVLGLLKKVWRHYIGDPTGVQDRFGGGVLYACRKFYLLIGV